MGCKGSREKGIGVTPISPSSPSAKRLCRLSSALKSNEMLLHFCYYLLSRVWFMLARRLACHTTHHKLVLQYNQLYPT